MTRFRFCASVALLVLIAAHTPVNAATHGRLQFLFSGPALNRMVFRAEESNVPLSTVVRQFAEQAGVTILLPNAELGQKTVSVKIVFQPLHVALDRLLQEFRQDYTYYAQGKGIYIVPRKGINAGTKPEQDPVVSLDVKEETLYRAL